jgi:transcription antitermination protein NusB
MSVTRTFARSSAAQALYQWQVGGQELTEIERQFQEERDLGRADVAYFKELLHGIPARVAEIDAALAAFTDRAVADIDPVERAILRLGCYELLFRPDIPCRVAINESINLAKRFGAVDSHKYVNGILDKVARQRRSREFSAV